MATFGEMSAQQLLDQAPATAGVYFHESKKILEDSGMDFDVKDVIELAKIAASDFNNAILCTAIQRGFEDMEHNFKVTQQYLRTNHGKFI